ncbi:type III secretion protein HrpB4 [Paraburkholderia sp. SARCC-3016]|uniref:type III secretion protein HrpB4 n=1 Tax=Paraburkholderia sp. SARCC-3016 TaxID=3058611 RepID=UPI0028078C62|nr:type III secretion protein HrpB4 [Paraburkholderia sp. SARCC-3016]MDQ7980262.1 type III secretion protein HrpB4 [Paraburkholderia sp. SARCC-3016]
MIGYNATHNVLAAAVTARLVEHHRRRRTLFDWIHPLRVAAMPCADQVRATDVQETPALAEAFLGGIGMLPPPLAAFSAPDAALVLLPAQECLTVFRLRALFELVEELRSWIDRPRRALLSEWVGAHGVRLLHGQRRRLAGNGTRPRLREMIDEANACALARYGFMLFSHECGWAPDGPLAIVQLALPEDATREMPEAFPAAHSQNLSRTIISQLPSLFPERSW